MKEFFIYLVFAAIQFENISKNIKPFFSYSKTLY